MTALALKKFQAFHQAIALGSIGQADPLNRKKLAGDAGDFGRNVGQRDRKNERAVIGNIVRALDGEFPFPSEITFGPLVRGGRDQRNKEGAGLDSFPNEIIPSVASRSS